MEDSYIKEATKTTPYALVDYKKGKIELIGRSSPENTMEFYHPFLKAITLLSSADIPTINVDFKLLYFNTSSARCIYLIANELKKLKIGGKNVSVNWYADEDDEDMVETGLDFQDIVGIKFNIQITKNPENLP